MDISYPALFASLLTLATTLLIALTGVVVSIYKRQTDQSIVITRIDAELSGVIRPRLDSLHEFRNRLQERELQSALDSLKIEREKNVQSSS